MGAKAAEEKNALLVPRMKPRLLFGCRAISPVLNLKLPVETFSSTQKWDPRLLNICVECSMSWNYTLLSSAVRLFAPFGTAVSQQQCSYGQSHKVQADSCTVCSRFSRSCRKQRSSRETLVSIVRSCNMTSDMSYCNCTTKAH